MQNRRVLFLGDVQWAVVLLTALHGVQICLRHGAGGHGTWLQWLRRGVREALEVQGGALQGCACVDDEVFVHACVALDLVLIGLAVGVVLLTDCRHQEVQLWILRQDACTLRQFSCLVDITFICVSEDVLAPFGAEVVLKLHH